MPLNISGSIVNSTIADTLDTEGIVKTGLKLYLDSDSVGSYPGNDTTYDLSGNSNDGTMYTGTGLTFDGSDDWVSFTNYVHPGACTLMVWIKTSNDGTICSHSSGGPVNMVYKIGSNKLSYDYYDGGWKNVSSTGTTVNDDTWHHVVFARSGTNHKFYVDGALDADTTMDASMSGTIDAIGRKWNGTYFGGLMSDFRIYSTQLSAAQISEIYRSPNTVLPTGVSASSLFRWWPLSEGSGTKAYDGSGNEHHGTLTNMAPTWTGGQPDIPQLAGKGHSNKMVFDGTNDYLLFGTTNLPSGNTNVSLSCWVWPTTSEDSGCFGYGSASTDTTFEIYMYNDSGTLKPAVHYAGGNGGTNLGLTLKGWNHIVATYDQTSSRTYVNGALSVTDAQALTIATTYRHIGAHNYGSAAGFFDGLIDECAIWNSTLDAAAVTAIYNSGVPIDLRNNSSNYDAYTDNLVGYWRNDGQGRWLDLSGNGNHGTVNGSPSKVSFPEGTTSKKDSQGFPSEISSFGFEGAYDSGNLTATDRIDLGDVGFTDGLQVFSVSVWFKVASASENHAAIFSKDNQIECWIKWNGNQRYALSVNNDHVDFTNSSTPLGEWVNVVWTWNVDGDVRKVYQNGVLVDTGSGNEDGVAITTGAVGLSIGARAAGHYPTNSEISNVRFYNRALSASEITHNFNVQRDRFGV